MDDRVVSYRVDESRYVVHARALSHTIQSISPLCIATCITTWVPFAGGLAHRTQQEGQVYRVLGSGRLGRLLWFMGLIGSPSH
jgi:hypothetical protein